MRVDENNGPGNGVARHMPLQNRSRVIGVGAVRRERYKREGPEASPSRVLLAALGLPDAEGLGAAVSEMISPRSLGV